MKVLLSLFFILFVTNSFSQDSSSISVYNISFNALDSGNLIRMSDYAGLKILVVEFDASKPNRQQLMSLDSLAVSKSNELKVIGIPVRDFSDSVDEMPLKAFIHDTLSLTYPISQISYAKKSTDTLQHPLMKWITHVEQNTHFDREVQQEGETYIISSDGTLYGLITDSNTPNSYSLLLQLLNQQPNN